MRATMQQILHVDTRRVHLNIPMDTTRSLLTPMATGVAGVPNGTGDAKPAAEGVAANVNDDDDDDDDGDDNDGDAAAKALANWAALPPKTPEEEGVGKREAEENMCGTCGREGILNTKRC